MVRKCNVCALDPEKANNRPSSHLYALPKDETVARRILTQLGFDESFVPNVSFKVCRRHFTADSFKSAGKYLNDDPVLIGFEKKELTRESLRVDDGKLYKLVEAPNQEPGQGKKVMILREATPPPKPRAMKATPNNTQTGSFKEHRTEIEKLKMQLHTAERSQKYIRTELKKLIKNEQIKNGRWSKEFNRKLEAILNPSTTRQSARLKSQSEDESESADDSEEEIEPPSPKKSRVTKTVDPSLAVVSQVKQEPKFELDEHHLYEDESVEPDANEEELVDEPKCEAF